jgi:hypothetical protein
MRVRVLLPRVLGAWLGSAMLVFVATAAAHSVIDRGVAPETRLDRAIAAASDVGPPVRVAGRAPALVEVDLPGLRGVHPPKRRHRASLPPRRTIPVVVTAPKPAANPVPAPSVAPPAPVVVRPVQAPAKPPTRPARPPRGPSFDLSG